MSTLMLQLGILTCHNLLYSACYTPAHCKNKNLDVIQTYTQVCHVDASYVALCRDSNPTSPDLCKSHKDSCTITPFTNKFLLPARDTC